MKVITYFCFTILSIFIQFSVMDLIKDKLLLDEDNNLALNLTSQKTELSDILEDFSSKPHALYYHSDPNGANKKYSNTPSPDSQQPSTTDATSTIFDVYLYENSSITESVFSATDSEHSTVFDNATEVTFLVNNNQTNKSDETTLIKYNIIKCECNLLYEVCDINCCCDPDCDSSHKIMFNCMTLHEQGTGQISDLCSHNLLRRSYGNIIDSLFCIVKTNLPEKRNVENKIHRINTNDQYLTWKRKETPSRRVKEFSKRPYKIGDPVWLLRNTTIYHMDLPTVTVNNYCTGRKPITFLKDEVINCKVKYEDLEMFRVIKIAEDSKIISAKDVTVNSTFLNCSSIHCTNWTIIVCDGDRCDLYNKKMHEPLCNKTSCTNIALTVEYVLYFYDFKIANVSVTLHIQNISTALPFMSQRIKVKFLLGNKTDDQIIEFSGSPGYKKGLNIISSFVEGNYTDNFYQNKIPKEKYFSVPINENGRCILPNFKFVQFGINKRSKCRYHHNNGSPYNSVDVCKHIQGNISELFHLNDNIVISPYGNPYNVKDKDWIRLRSDHLVNESVYRKVGNSVHCDNVISRVSMTFTFMNVYDENNNTILSVNIAISTMNISFNNMQAISTVLTTDINFVNMTKPPVVEYAGPPRLNIYLPKDFFFPYSSNNSNRNENFVSNTFLYCTILKIVLFANKITFS